MLVFIDDSGDPGFKIDKGSSKVFVIALVIFKDELEAEKCSVAIKELKRKLHLSDRFEFKFNKTNKIFRKSFFDKVAGFDFKVRAILVDKQIIYSSRLKNYKENFYNYVIMQVLRHNGGSIKKARLKFDGRGERELRNELRVYLSRELNNKKNSIFKDLKFVDSRQNTLIQLADMVAGSITCAYSRKDRTFLEVLRKNKRIEDIWDFK